MGGSGGWLVGHLTCVCLLLAQTVSAHQKIPLNNHVHHYESLLATFHSEVKSHRLRRSTDRTDRTPLEISLSGLGRDFKLHLYPDHLPRLEAEHGEYLHYTGVVYGVESSRVHGYFHDDGVFDGVIHTPDETYFVEHARKLFKEKPDFPAVMYKASDVTFTNRHGELVCGSILNNITPYRENTVQEVKPQTQSKARRQSEPPPAISKAKNTCRVKLVADHTYVDFMGGRMRDVISEMTNILVQVDYVFANATIIPGIPLHVALSDYDPISVYTSPHSYPAELAGLGDEKVTVEDLLKSFSSGQWNPYCLAHLFTHRDFDNGVLGLAWVGRPDSLGLGGICQDSQRVSRTEFQNLNTGLNTNLNYGTTMAKAVNIITVAHEIGHGFGSDHDPDRLPCTGAEDGNYVMYARATTAKMPNNKKFSECSIKQMARVANSKGSCFTDYPGAVCGNGVLENEEQCDSGGEGDRCCTKQCKLAPKAVCSPMNEPCCSDSCQIANTSEICRPGGECVMQTFCDGLSTICPNPRLYPSNTTCGSSNLSINAYLCRAGVCSVETATPSKPPVTVCSLFEGATTCARGTCAPAGPDECKVCCNFDNSTERCEPLENYCLKNPNVIGCMSSGGLRKAYLPGGTPCSNTNGYCTVNATCKVVNVNPPTLLGVQSASDFFEYTWYFWVAGLLVVVVFSMIYLIISRLCPSKRRLRRKAIEQKQRDVIAAHRQAKHDEKVARASGTNRPSANLDAIAGLAIDPTDQRTEAKKELPRLPEATSVISLNEDPDKHIQPRVPPQGQRNKNSTRPSQPQRGAQNTPPPPQNTAHQNWGKQGNKKGSKAGTVKYV